MAMDDARIRQLTEEVLREIQSPRGDERLEAGLEQRVAALEARVAELGSASPRAASVALVRAEIPALRLMDVPGGGATGECSLEPGRPCVGSGRCRTFGH
jgi:hypothetical protein